MIDFAKTTVIKMCTVQLQCTSIYVAAKCKHLAAAQIQWNISNNNIKCRAGSAKNEQEWKNAILPQNWSFLRRQGKYVWVSVCALVWMKGVKLGQKLFQSIIYGTCWSDVIQEHVFALIIWFDRDSELIRQSWLFTFVSQMAAQLHSTLALR